MNAETEDDTLDLFAPAAATTPDNPPSQSADKPADGDWEKELWPSTPPGPPLVEGEGIRQVHIGWLKPHAFSLKVYGEEATDKDLVESIKAVGIQNPLKVTVDGVVISGHRRLKAAKQTDLETVPVFVARPRYASITMEEQILEANRSRVKDNEQKVREFLAYKVIETARAKARNGYRLDLVPNSAPGDAEPETGVSVFAEAALARDVGKARDIAARKVGMAGSTAADGEKVVAALDRLWAAENYRDYGELREALLKSIHAALKLGLDRGWIPQATKKLDRQSVTTTAKKSSRGPARSGSPGVIVDVSTPQPVDIAVQHEPSAEPDERAEINHAPTPTVSFVAPPLAEELRAEQAPTDRDKGHVTIPLATAADGTPEALPEPKLDEHEDDQVVARDVAPCLAIDTAAVQTPPGERASSAEQVSDPGMTKPVRNIIPSASADSVSEFGNHTVESASQAGTVFHLANGSEVTLASANEGDLIADKKLRAILQVSSSLGDKDAVGSEVLTRRQQFVMTVAETMNRLGKAAPNVPAQRLWTEFCTANRILQKQMKWN